MIARINSEKYLAILSAIGMIGMIVMICMGHNGNLIKAFIGLNALGLGAGVGKAIKGGKGSHDKKDS